MSTADSQLLVLTSSLTEDIPAIQKMDDRRKELISRLGVIGFALLAFLIASSDSGNILNMVGYAWGGFGAAFGPVILLSLLWRKTTWAGGSYRHDRRIGHYLRRQELCQHGGRVRIRASPRIYPGNFWP